MSQFFRDSLKMVKARSSKIKSAVLKSQLEDTFTMSEAIMDEYSRAIDNIRNDNRLSADGKLSERKKIADSTRTRLDELKKPLERLEREAIQLQQEAAKSTEPENAVLEYLRQREIRDRMGNDPALEQKYLRAIESGQNLTLAEALENSPVEYDFISAATRQKTAMHKLPPEARERMTDIGAFKVFVTGAIDSGMTAINQTQHG